MKVLWPCDKKSNLHATHLSSVSALEAFKKSTNDNTYVDKKGLKQQHKLRKLNWLQIPGTDALLWNTQWAFYPLLSWNLHTLFEIEWVLNSKVFRAIPLSTFSRVEYYKPCIAQYNTTRHKYIHSIPKAKLLITKSDGVYSRSS